MGMKRRRRWRSERKSEGGSRGRLYVHITRIRLRGGTISARPRPPNPQMANPHGAMIQELLCASDTRPLQRRAHWSKTRRKNIRKQNGLAKGRSSRSRFVNRITANYMYAKRTANHMYHDTAYGTEYTYRLLQKCICNRGIGGQAQLMPHCARHHMRNEERQRKTPLRTLPTPPSGTWPATYLGRYLTAGTKRGSSGTGVRPQLVK